MAGEAQILGKAVPLRVLIVEDRDDDVLLLLRQLRRAGYDPFYRVVWQADAMTNALREEEFDVVLSDYFMPGFNAIEALNIFRASGRDIPFIIVSGSIGEDLAVRAMKAGVHDYVMKDNLSRLGGAIDRELRDAALRRERRRMEDERQDLLGRERRARESAEIHAAQLARANAELEQYAFAASHDLQEPLRVITSYVQLLRRSADQKLNGDEQEFLGYIESGASRMRNLISDLLAYSRVIGEREIQFESVETRAIVEQAIQDCRKSIEEAGAQFECGDLPVVLGEADQLRQVFENLITNAVKYSRPGEPPRVRITARRLENDGWQFDVADNGIGIKPEYQDRIFGLFKRLHGRDVPGTGIGLAICRRVVESHGGHIWVESAGLGHGSTFHFTLPSATN